MPINGFRLLATCIAIMYASAAQAAEQEPAPAESAGNQLERSATLIARNLYSIDDDLRGIFRYPFDHPKRTAWFLLGTAGLVAVDKPVTRYYQDKVEPLFDGYSLQAPRDLGKMGFGGADGYLALGVGGSYVLGLLLNDEKSQQAALLAGKAAVYSGVASHLILKPLTGRSRPVPNLSSATRNEGPYTTSPFAFGHFYTPRLGAYQYGTAMPSFHFTVYFAVARVYQKVYDNYLIPYGLAAAGLVSNIRGHKHWVSDMVAGALIGTMIGSVVTDNALDETPKQPAWMVVPNISPEMTGLTLFCDF